MPQKSYRGHGQAMRMRGAEGRICVWLGIYCLVVLFRLSLKSFPHPFSLQLQASRWFLEGFEEVTLAGWFVKDINVENGITWEKSKERDQRCRCRRWREAGVAVTPPRTYRLHECWFSKQWHLVCNFS